MMKVKVFLISIVMAASSLSYGVIQPRHYKKSQDLASEFLTIYVADVSKDICFFCSVRDITVKAEVKKVHRSKSGLRIGDIITIEYQSDSRRICGPRTIPILKKDKTYPAYLNIKQDGECFVPASRGWSFETVH